MTSGQDSPHLARLTQGQEGARHERPAATGTAAEHPATGTAAEHPATGTAAEHPASPGAHPHRVAGAPRRWRWVVAAALLVVGADLLASAGGRLGASGAPTRAAQSPSPGQARNAAARPDTVAGALAARAAAVRDHDGAALTALVDPSVPALVAAQRAQSSALAQLPLGTYDYRLGAVTTSGDRATAAVTLAYAFAGFDTAPLTATETDTYVRRDGRWQLTAVTGATPEIWDYGPLTVVRGAHSLVVATPATASAAAALAAAVDADVPEVTSVWGTDWDQRAVVLLPGTAAQFSALTGEPGDLSQIAGTESTETGTPGARVELNPTVWPTLSTVGQQVTLTHELTHVASARYSTASTPSWLVEGLADAVGYANSGLTTAQVCAELATDVRAGRVPTALPTTAAYGPQNGDLAATYEQGYLAATLVESRVGAAGLVRLYRLVGGSGLPQDQAVSAGLRQVLGLGLPAFTQDWLQRVRGLA